MPTDDPLFPKPVSRIDEVLTLPLPTRGDVLAHLYVAQPEAPSVHNFNVDVEKLLQVIQRFFSSPEVFIRELISNASDALGRFKMQGLGLHPELSIKIEIDREGKTICIEDNGIGMTKTELVRYLGTIGKSGTREYSEFLTSLGLTDATMIGQFGICFYSVFLVAHKVMVSSKNDDDEQHIWESEGDGNFTVAKDISGEKLVRGTRVTLFLKADQMVYLEVGKIEELVKKYSQFISYPIYIKK